MNLSTKLLTVSVLIAGVLAILGTILAAIIEVRRSERCNGKDKSGDKPA